MIKYRVDPLEYNLGPLSGKLEVADVK